MIIIYVWTLPLANCDIPRATSEILDLEQLIFDIAIALDAASSQWAELASRLQGASRDLLQHARELPDSKISTKALPRRLRRHEVFHLAQGRLPEMEKDELGGMPRAARIESGTVGIGWKWAGSSYLPPFSISEIQPMHHQNPPKAPVKLPPAVLKALADTLEAGRCDASLQTLVMIP